MRKSVLKNVAKFSGKHLRRIPFFDKVAGLRSFMIFYCEFCETFWNTFFCRQKQSLEVFYKKGVLKNFAELQLCQSLFFSNVGCLKPATLLRKTLAQVFSCEFCEIFKNTFSTEHIQMTASEQNTFWQLVFFFH